jgi:hypothetical protein
MNVSKYNSNYIQPTFSFNQFIVLRVSHWMKDGMKILLSVVAILTLEGGFVGMN